MSLSIFYLPTHLPILWAPLKKYFLVNLSDLKEHSVIPLKRSKKIEPNTNNEPEIINLEVDEISSEIELIQENNIFNPIHADLTFEDFETFIM